MRNHDHHQVGTTTLRLGALLVGLGIVAPSTVALAAPDQGITSAVHRKHVGRVVFSKQPIPFKRENPRRFATTFRAADRIYGRLYLARALSRYPHFTDQGHRLKGRNDKGEWAVRLTVDGQEQRYSFGYFHTNNIRGKARTFWTSFQVNLNAPGNDYDDRKMRTNWARVIAKLSPGRHTVRVEIISMLASYKTRRPVAVGTFTLLKRKGEGIAAGRMPKAAMRNAGLASAMRRALRAKRIAKSARDIKRVVITSNWQHGRYRGTIRRYRMVNGTVLWRDKKGNGMCRYVTYKFVSDRRGGGWTPLRFRGFCMGCPEGWVRCK